VEKRATTRFVPRVVFRTTFTGVIPVCVAVACGPVGAPDALDVLSVARIGFVPDGGQSAETSVGSVAGMAFAPDGGNLGVAFTGFVPDGGQSAETSVGSVALTAFGPDGGNLSVANRAFGPDSGEPSVASMAFGPDGGNLSVANRAFGPDGGESDAPCEGPPGCFAVANEAFGPDGGGRDAGEHTGFVVACIGFNGEPCGQPEHDADAFGDAGLDASRPAHTHRDAH
jgi:hypothetical protein